MDILNSRLFLDFYKYWGAVLLFIPYLWISMIHFRIFINHHWISINDLRISIMHWRISLNRIKDIHKLIYLIRPNYGYP